MSDKTTVENAKGDKEVVENPHLNPESLTITERIEALVTGYAHGLEHSAPRTQAELDELKSILFGAEAHPLHYSTPFSVT